MASASSQQHPKAEPHDVPAAEVLIQLDRILSSPHFRNSRRCQSLLRYVVMAATEHRFDALKERVVGCEVFGRHPDYDTNEDAVVRNAAAEVRKRLAQYYQETGHENELRITLLPGSYLPEFRMPAASAVQPLSASVPTRSRTSFRLAGGLVLAGLAAGVLLSILFTPLTPAVAPILTELDQFWGPTVAAPGETQILVGQTRGYYLSGRLSIMPTGELDLAGPIDASRLRPMRDVYLYFGDSFCLARVNGYLLSQGKTSRFRGAAVTPYSELRGQAVVLIGAFNNQWTLRLTEGLRFSLVNDGPDVRGVRDSQQAGNRPWKLVLSQSGWIGEEDYALITRVFDPNTERVVVATGGIGHFGTMATGDFLSNPAYFRNALKSAPKDWAKRNMQIVLKVKVADGTPGPPEVLATHFW